MSEVQADNKESSEQGKSSRISQSQYRPTQFGRQEWEVLGTIQEEHQFEPFDIEVVASSEFVTDPMFADFGGTSQTSTVKRWRAQEKAPVSSAPVEKTIPETEVKKMLAEAEAKGRAAATEEAKALRDAEIEKLKSNLTSVIDEVNKFVQKSQDEIEKTSVRIAIELSKKIIEQAVEINPEYIVEVLKQALTHAGSATIKKVKVSAQDLEFIEIMGLSKKLKEFDGSWTFEADESVKAGCLIETSAGEVDFDLHKAWERIAAVAVRMVK